MNIKTIGLICKPNEKIVEKAILAIVPTLQSKNIRVLYDESTRRHHSYDRITSREELCKESNLVIVIGGDGTLLNAARSASLTGTPILGINLGRLGFLVDISPENIKVEITKILEGHFISDQRMLLQGQVFRHGKIVYERYAFNDVVYHMHGVVRMVEFETRIDQRFVSLQRADGLIISTPTGSTAYALSAGGPIVEPSLDAMILAPICPHTLNSRPIVIDAKRTVNILPKARNGIAGQVSFDGQETFSLKNEDNIEIKKAENTVTLIHPEAHNFFHVLREKLNWAEQP